ncbi:MAG: S-layer homology domain-containing protein [Clostridiales bacterium]|nr:S-layer homology domain-containing protein [Clostridiales bacterium]
MNTGLTKLISKLTAAALAVSMLPGAVCAHANGTKVYEFDMTTVSSFDADAAKSRGFSFDNTNNIWSPAFENKADSIYMPAARFTTKANDGTRDYELYKLTFANDSQGNPDGEKLTGEKYVFEMEFCALYNSESYMTLDFIGKDSVGAEKYIANARLTFNRSENLMTFAFVDDQGQTIGAAEPFKANNLAAKNGAIGIASALQYIKAEFDFTNQTFSAWHTLRKVDEGEYSAVQASDDNKIIDNAPMNSDNIGEFVGFSASTTKNSATNGYRIKYIGVSEGVETVQTPKPENTQTPVPTATHTPKPENTPTPTATPEVPAGEETLIDEEDFTGKTVEDNALDGWEFYDKTDKVSAFSNVSLSMVDGALKILKTSTANETDYSDRYRSMYRFKEVTDEDENTKTYMTNLRGKYKIVTVANSHVQSGSQFQEINPAMGDAGIVPAMVYNMCIDSSGAYEYISSSNKPKLYSGSLIDKDTTYTYIADTETGELITTVNDGEEYKKTFKAGTPLQGIMYVLKNQSKVNDYMTVKNIKLYRIGESGANAAAQAAKSLLMSDICDTPDSVSGNLKTLPKTADGAAVSWTSSKPSVIDDSGKLIDQPLDGSETVVMTATLSKGDDVAYKDFTLKVSKLDTNNFELIDDVDFEGDGVNFEDNGGTHKIEDGKILLTRTASSQTPSVKIYPMWDNMQFNATGSWVFETEVSMPDDAYQKMELVLYDTNGQRITSFYTTCKSTGTVLTGVAREELSASAVHKELPSGTNGAISMKIKVMFNTDTQRMSLYAALNGEQEYTTLFNNKYLREDAQNLSYIQVLANSDNNSGDSTLCGTLKIEGMRLYTPQSNKLGVAVDNIKYYNPVEALGGYIKSDVELTTAAYPGMAAKWTSSNPEILSDDGKLNSSAYTEDTPVSLTFRLTLDGTDQYIEKTFDLVAVWVDKNNIAMDKNADTGKTQPMTGHNAKKAVDGSIGTWWQTMRFSDLPALTVDLECDEVLDKIILYEADMMGEYPIKGYVIETSRDASTWKTLYSGTTIGEAPHTISVNSAIARYVRFRVTDKAQDCCVGLREMMIYAASDSRSKAQADITLALDSIGTLTNMTQNKTLPSSMRYGSTLTYKSSIPEAFSDSGAVNCQNKLVSGTLTITAVNGGETVTQTVPVSVAQKSTGGGSSGGSTGGSSGGGGGGGVTSPALPGTGNTISPTPTKKPETGIFNDVEKSFWAYNYIENLAKDGVVSGDNDRNFRPGDNISRQEFVKILLLAAKIDVSGAKDAGFSDVKEGDWSYPYIAKAVELGIVNGVTDTEFAKESPITREDIAVMCKRTLMYLNRYSAPEKEAVFADRSDISQYAAEAVDAMNELGILEGYEDNSFRPKNNATRAESAKIIYMLTR